MKSRLAAVAMADVVGYTTLVQVNLPATIGAWKELRDRVVAPSLQQRGGSLVDRAGDGLFCEFSSAASAVCWALDVQEEVPRWRLKWPEPKLALRIGIHVDDVILDAEDKPTGPGVSIASRIQSLADPDRVVVTGAVRDLVLGKLPLRFFAQGPRQLRNVVQRTQVFRVEREPSGQIDSRDYPAAPDWSSWPTVAVLPFVVIGETGTDPYYGAGISGEIVDFLDKTRSVVVIASASTLRFANRNPETMGLVGMTAIGAELGVRYLLDGTVQRRGGDVAVRAELVDAESGRKVWSDKFQGEWKQILDIPERIARSIVGSLEPHLLRNEMDRVRNRSKEGLDAYDCMLQGIPLLYRLNGRDFEEAGRLFRKAVSLDPAFARGFAYLAWWHNFLVGEERTTERRDKTSAAERYALRAIELDPADPIVLSVAGHIQSFLKRDYEAAIEYFNRALECSPCSAFAWAVSAPTYTYRGRPDIAIERVQTAEALSPRDPMRFKYLTSEGGAWFVAGDYAKAIQVLKLARMENRHYNPCNRVLAAALALSNQQEEAEHVAAEYIREHPQFRVSTFERWYPLQPPDMARLASGLRSAGMPE